MVSSGPVPGNSASTCYPQPGGHFLLYICRGIHPQGVASGISSASDSAVGIRERRKPILRHCRDSSGGRLDATNQRWLLPCKVSLFHDASSLVIPGVSWMESGMFFFLNLLLYDLHHIIHTYILLNTATAPIHLRRLEPKLGLRLVGC